MVFIKIALVNPYFHSVKITREGHEDLGLLYIATAVEEFCEIYLYDAIIDNKTEYQVAEEIININADIVGISLKFSSCLPSVIKIVEELRKRGFNGYIIMGGNFATFMHEYLLKNGICDIVVLHEGEETFKDIVKLLSSNRFDVKERLKTISGIAFKDSNDEVKKTKERSFLRNIDDIKIPNRKYYDEYYKKSSSAYVFTSRGCSFSCYYCSTSKMWGDLWRGRSADNLLFEIKNIKQLYPNITDFNFIDDNFMINRKRVEKFIDLIKKEQLSNISFRFSSRAELLDKEILDKLKSIGTSGIFMGIESGSPRILKTMNRHYSPSEVIDKVSYAESIGIKITASFMIGLPFEKTNDMEKTLELIEVLPSSHTQCHIFTPFPGTPCYNNPELYGFRLSDVKPEEISLDADVYMLNPVIDKEKLILMHRKALSIIKKKQIKNKIRERGII